MSDRELLELAAKAAGMTHLYCEPWKGMAEYNKHLDEFYGPTWNPLTDDGDALRLAVKLYLDVHIDTNLTDVTYMDSVTEAHLRDPYAATRRAIVRAAAEIGRTL